MWPDLMGTYKRVETGGVAMGWAGQHVYQQEGGAGAWLCYQDGERWAVCSALCSCCAAQTGGQPEEEGGWSYATPPASWTPDPSLAAVAGDCPAASFQEVQEALTAVTCIPVEEEVRPELVLHCIRSLNTDQEEEEPERPPPPVDIFLNPERAAAGRSVVETKTNRSRVYFQSADMEQLYPALFRILWQSNPPCAPRPGRPSLVTSCKFAGEQVFT